MGSLLIQLLDKIIFVNYPKNRKLIFKIALLIKGHSYGHLPAVVALLFVLAVLGFRVARADALEVRVGHVVEDDAALR